jgi:hypothetical protein
MPYKYDLIDDYDFYVNSLGGGCSIQLSHGATLLLHSIY